jgi:glucuronokinase
MAAASGRALARAALAGNPSDAYGGATLAVVVPEFGAEVRIETVAKAEGAGISVEPANRLVAASIARLVRDHGGGEGDVGRAAGLAATWTTSIPREVGLGGSSALVIATLRALAELFGVTFSSAQLAALALAIERDELGIAAGPQDRVAQAFGGLTFMDFDLVHATGEELGRYELLDPGLLPPLYLAYRADAHDQSGAIHGDLRERFDSGDPEIRGAMSELAGHARGARDALLAGDRERFDACVDASFDVRRRIVELDTRHLELVELARALGASANYTGSGGAVVGACRDDDHRRAVVAGLSDGVVRALPFAP